MVVEQRKVQQMKHQFFQQMVGGWRPPTLCSLTVFYLTPRACFLLLCNTNEIFQILKKRNSVAAHIVPHKFPYGGLFLRLPPDGLHNYYSVPRTAVLSWRARHLLQRGAAGGRGPAPVLRGWGARVGTGCAPCSGRT